MYTIVENRKSESTKYLVLCIILLIILSLQIRTFIINQTIFVFELIGSLVLFILFLFRFLTFMKYTMELNEEKIIIKAFKTKLIKIQDIDYYAFSASRINDTFDVIILIKGQEIKIRTHYIKEMIDVFYNNNVKRIDGLNVNAINKQAASQKFAFIIILIVFILTIIFVSGFKPYARQKIKSKEINSALNTYYLVDNNRFAIFPQNVGKIIDQGFVKTKTGMQIYLISKYSEADFEREYKRLYNPSLKEYVWPKEFVSGFNYRTIVTKYGNNVFEYACLNANDNIIAYIYFENTRYDDIAFDKIYIPLEFQYYYNEIITTSSKYDYYGNPNVIEFKKQW